MRARGRTKQWEAGKFRKAYGRLLREYAKKGGEAALKRASELGRQALGERASILDVAAIHQEALSKLLRKEKEEQRKSEQMRAGTEFFAECLFPYEMAHRGFHDVLQALRQVNETLEAEIKRIAYAVHDEAGQLLVAVHLALAEVARELPKAKRKKIGQVEALLNQVEKGLRQYSHELRPTILDDLGWIPAVRLLAEGISKRSGVAIHIQAGAAKRLPGAAETAIYRVMQEALRNVLKHANAKNVWIRAGSEEGMLRCSIQDDGRGFDNRTKRAGNARRGLGLIAMQERVSAVGGSLEIATAPGRGTALILRIPMESEHASAGSVGG